MNLQQQRIIEVTITHEQLHDKLLQWAESRGFKCISEIPLRGLFNSPPLPTRWVFQRGSEWQAILAGDIRKIPTELTIEIVAEAAQIIKISCSIKCDSNMRVPVAGDAESLTAELENLEFALKNAIN
jgi:hypothetical protein